MPELPEAEVVARQLRDRLFGGRLVRVHVRRADIVRQGLSTARWYEGGTVVEVHRVGKSVVLTIEQGAERRHLLAELGMTGLLLFRLPAAKYEKHRHLSLDFEGCGEAALHYWNPRRFGRIYLLDQAELARFVARRFGADPLAVSWEDFRRIIESRRGRLKSLLMHQHIVAGIGNIYANEILFRCKLHPHRTASRLREPAIRRLFEVTRRVLEEAILAGGSSVRDYLAPDGRQGRFAGQHLVYNKAGASCPNPGCREVIRRLKGERSSFLCPACQPRPRLA